MHRRLTGIYLALLVVTTLGLALPLGLAVVDRESNRMLLDRTADAASFSSLAENAVLTGQARTITGELEIYEQTFGISTVLIDSDANVVASSSPQLTLAQLQSAAGESSQQPAEQVLAALAGVRQEHEGRLWPWTSNDLLVAEPVNDSGETIGAVVTSSPTAAVTRSMWIQWAVIAAAVLAVLALGALAARPISRWVLRPVTELTQTVEAVRGGDLGARVSAVDGPGELKQLGSAFNEMSATIQQILDRQRSFVAYAGHQLRNPLAAVRLRVESLGEGLSGQQLQAHTVVLEELDRLTRTCQGLLSLALSADAELDRVQIDIAYTAARRHEAWLPIAEQLGAHIERDIATGLRVRTLEHTVEQTLDVLIDNALKFGGRGVTVRIAASRLPSDEVEIAVEDDGPGLPDELLQDAVIPFWRRESAEEGVPTAAQGTGLGLSAVVSLLELDGGSLSLHPRSPHGTRALIRLKGPAAHAGDPLWPDDSSPAPLGEAAPAELRWLHARSAAEPPGEPGPDGPAN